MANDKKATFHKVGAVFKKKAKPGVVVTLGNSQAKSEKYRTSVEVTLFDAQGKKITSIKDGFLTVLDPRKRAGITEEQLGKIPQNLISELFIVENND